MTRDGYMRAGRLHPEHYSDERSYGVLVVDVFTCERCGALVSEEATSAHDNRHGVESPQHRAQWGRWWIAVNMLVLLAAAAIFTLDAWVMVWSSFVLCVGFSLGKRWREGTD